MKKDLQIVMYILIIISILFSLYSRFGLTSVDALTVPYSSYTDVAYPSAWILNYTNSSFTTFNNVFNNSFEFFADYHDNQEMDYNALPYYTNTNFTNNYGFVVNVLPSKPVLKDYIYSISFTIFYKNNSYARNPDSLKIFTSSGANFNNYHEVDLISTAYSDSSPSGGYEFSQCPNNVCEGFYINYALSKTYMFTFKANSNDDCFTVFFNADRKNYPANTFQFSALGTVDNLGRVDDVSNADLSQKIDSLNEEQKKTNEELNNLNKNITSDDTSGANSIADRFFGDFEEDNFGLQDVVTAPLVFIRNLLNHSCEPLDLQLPFVNKIIHLPCMHAIYTEYFGLFFTLYQTITTGVIAYAVLIRIFATVKGLQDPQNDKIQVMNL